MFCSAALLSVAAVADTARLLLRRGLRAVVVQGGGGEGHGVGGWSAAALHEVRWGNAACWRHVLHPECHKL